MANRPDNYLLESTGVQFTNLHLTYTYIAKSHLSNLSLPVSAETTSVWLELRVYDYRSIMQLSISNLSKQPTAVMRQTCQSSLQLLFGKPVKAACSCYSANLSKQPAAVIQQNCQSSLQLLFGKTVKAACSCYSAKLSKQPAAVIRQTCQSSLQLSISIILITTLVLHAFSLQARYWAIVKTGTSAVWDRPPNRFIYTNKGQKGACDCSNPLLSAWEAITDWHNLE